MALSHTPSEDGSQTETSRLLGKESQARVDATVNAALKILESTPEMKEKLQGLFDTMVQQNLRDPEKIIALQDGLYISHQERIKDLAPEQKKIAEASFTKFIENFSQNIAYMHRDINWSNELLSIKQTYEQKKNSLQSQYATIIHNDHPSQTA